MKIVYFASGDIAVLTLKTLCGSSHEVCCVVTATDKKKGRHLKAGFTPVKQCALEQKINIFQPQDVRGAAVLEALQSFKADLFIVFSYGKILPKEILSLPKFFSLNIHASLLPHYRGPAPIARALFHGETKTGITFIRMNEHVDGGDMIQSYEIPIAPADNAGTLEQKLALLSSETILDVVEKISEKQITFTPQPKTAVAYASKLKKCDGKINWFRSAIEIDNQIRGCYGWPGAFFQHKGKMIKIWAAEVVLNPQKSLVQPGLILDCTKKGILVAAGQDFLLITELQSAAGKRLSAWHFLQGHHLRKEDVLD